MATGRNSQMSEDVPFGLAYTIAKGIQIGFVTEISG
jgi:hypothetical protein